MVFLRYLSVCQLLWTVLYKKIYLICKTNTEPGSKKRSQLCDHWAWHNRLSNTWKITDISLVKKCLGSIVDLMAWSAVQCFCEVREDWPWKQGYSLPHCLNMNTGKGTRFSRHRRDTEGFWDRGTHQVFKAVWHGAIGCPVFQYQDPWCLKRDQSGDHWREGRSPRPGSLKPKLFWARAFRINCRHATGYI